MKKKFFLAISIGLFLIGIATPFAQAGATPQSFVYTINNSSSGNSILQFVAGPGGAIAPAGSFATGGSGTGVGLASQGALTITSNGHWIVAVDAGSDQVTAFQVNQDGSLTWSSIVSSHGMTPVSVTVHENMVYVLNAGSSTVAGSIAGFKLSHDGQLTFVAGSLEPVLGPAGSSPEQIGFSNDGRVLVVTEKAANIIDTYVVTNGVAAAPIATASNSPGPYGFAFNNQGYLVLSEAATGTLSSYSVSDSGTLTTISSSIPDFGLAPCWVTISPDGRLAYTSNAHGGTISSYRISGTGTLSLSNSAAGTASIPTLDLALSSNGHILYALNGGQITTFHALEDGSLVMLSSAGVPASSTGIVASG